MDTFFWGTPVVAGYALARAQWVRHTTLPGYDPEFRYEGDARSDEHERFTQACAVVGERLRKRAMTTVGAGTDIILAASQIVDDPGLAEKVHALISEGYSAHCALVNVMGDFIEAYQRHGGLLIERVTDLENTRDRLIAQMYGINEPGIPWLDNPSIILADDLSPVDTAGMDPTLVKAIVTRQGGPTSHTSIIARQLGIPCIVAARFLPDDRELNGHEVFVDSVLGVLDIAPDIDVARRKVQIFEQMRERAQQWRGPARLASGEHVELLVNVQDSDSALSHLSQQADGVGLYRTELAVMNRVNEPSVDEQSAIYRSVLDAFHDKKVIVRTLDAGSDKPVAWLPLGIEQNPALGVRGLRTSGPHPLGLFHQLDAIVAAAKGHDGPVGVMAPMVSTITETEWFAQIVHQRGLNAGIMIETPSAAVLAEQFLPAVDFVSIGTNDLTQYVMAADRLNPSLATYTDTWQPAVLRLIRIVIEAGLSCGTPVGICGEAGADPVLACVFIGMGATSLSMAPSGLAYVGTQLEQVTIDACKLAAEAVRDARDPGDARLRARKALGLDT
ncbi:MAG: PEP-utilizing enzyme [Actinomycetaceae bacterium]|nr:PEP-utilizing enzyme [Actinomycetaceae bacterium]